MPSLPITNISPRIQYTAAAGQTAFTFPFYLFSTGDISVYRTALNAAPNEVTNKLTLTTQYSVTININNTGGTVTLVTPSTLGDTITLIRTMAPTRLGFYATGASFTADGINTDFESEVLMIQQGGMVDNLIGPRYNLNAQVSATRDLLLPILGANQTWVMNPAGTSIIASNLASPVTQINTAGLATGGPITATGTITVTAATSADVTAGTSTTRAVTPASMAAHKGMPIAWVIFQSNGVAPVIQDSYNIASAAKTGTGRWVVNFTNAATTSAFGVTGTCFSFPVSTPPIVTEYGTIVPVSSTTTSSTFYTMDAAGNRNNFTRVMVWFFGS